ncbi:hypothetical protein ES705_11964 [subsurface metagenome]
MVQTLESLSKVDLIRSIEERKLRPYIKPEFEIISEKDVKIAVEKGTEFALRSLCG